MIFSQILCREDSVTNIFLVKNFATPPRAVALRLSSPIPDYKIIIPKSYRFSLINLVSGMGLEPISLTAGNFKSPVYTIPPPGHI